MKKKNSNKGITLIALVITIIVLLILAGVSIAMLTGQNGILTQASNARLETEYSNITDSMSLAVTEYNTLKQTDETVAETSFIDWLKGKGYINNSNEIQVANLLGQTMSTGNGTGTSDVYKIEEVTETAKIASTIKVGAIEAEIEKEYKIVYYDKEGNPTELKTFTLSTTEELEETDPKLFIVEDGVISLKDFDAYYYGNKEWTIENVVIPSEVDGQKVTEIPKDLFCAYQNYYEDFLKFDKIKSIVIPEGVTTIQDGHIGGAGTYGAFRNLQNLESVTLPSTLETIGGNTFMDCKKLKNIELPDSLEYIGTYAFCSTNIEKINIPKSVKEISYDAFDRCEQLNEIKVEEGNPTYDSRNNCNALIETATNKLLKGTNNTIIPDGIEVIGDSAFSSCNNLQTITIPESVTTISYQAFNGCTGIKEIFIPSTVTLMEYNVFGGWTSEQKIHVPFASTDSPPEGWNNIWDSECNARIIHTDEE